MVTVCRCGRTRVSQWLLLPRVRALPRSPGDRSCRGVLEPPSPRSLFTHTCLVSCAAGQSAPLVLFVIMHALTPASSTPATFPRALFATLVTSRRRVLERRRGEAFAQGLLVRRLHLGVLLPLSARGLTRVFLRILFARCSSAVWCLQTVGSTPNRRARGTLFAHSLFWLSCAIGAGRVWLEQRASPSLLADRLGAL